MAAHGIFRPGNERVLLAVIVILAALLRLKGLDWGSNLYLHPDERFQTMVVTRIAWPDSVPGYFDSEHSTLNPYNNDFGTYIYGTFPLFVAKFLGDLTGDDVYGNAHLPGRTMSALLDVLNVVLVYLIGKRLFGARTGLLASALMAVTVLNIQSAHFFAPDLYVTAFCLAAFYFALRAQDDAHWKWFVGAGICVGLALASKINAAAIVAVLALPALERIRRSGIRAALRPAAPGQLSPIFGAALALFAAVWTFRITQPYAFLGPSLLSFRLDPRWVDDLRYWREVQRGSDTPPGLQWANRTPVLFALKNLVLWGMGPLLGLTALASLLFYGFVTATRRRLPPSWLLVLVGWPAFHLIYYGFAFVQTMRYVLPAYPFLILLAAAGLARLARYGKRQGWPTVPMVRGTRLPLSVAPMVIVLAGTALYALAFSGIYTRPTTRELASRWIYENVPPSSVIASEHWDDGIPVSIPGYDTRAYESFQLELFFPDSEEKLANVLDQLDRAEFIVITSNRLYGTIPRIPERFPMTSEYYRMLFSGELGFDLVHEETSYPSLLGIELVDDSAEEAFTVYDHPRVFVFQKSGSYSRSAIEPRLTAALGDGAYAIGPLEAGFNRLMMDDETRESQQAGGTWRQIVSSNGLIERLPALIWYLALQLMGLAALPLCHRLFPQLPDRGYAVAKTAGVLLVSYLAWLCASLGIVSFGRGAVVLGLVVTASASLAAVWSRREAVVRDFVDRRRLILATEGLFLTAFLLMVWLRAQNPDLWHPSRGGEKPMDFAYFNAVLRSTSFPAFDPWFAGGYLNYYYFGFVQWASITRLTGIVPEVAYNLAVPSILALVAINLWSFGVATVARIRSTDVTQIPGRLLGLALAAPLVVLVLGNLDLARRVGRGEYGFPPGRLSGWLPSGLGDILAGVGSALAPRPELPNDLYWAATRIVPATINEFPFFTFLFADLHAHMMAMPLASAALMLAFQIATSTAGDAREELAQTDQLGAVLAWRDRVLRWIQGQWSEHGTVALEIMAVGFLTSALYATNTWDFPTYLAILTGALVIREGSRQRWQVTYPSVVRIGLWLVLAIAAGRIAFWPFYSHFHTRGGIMRFHERTSLGDYLAIHGLMLVAIIGLLVLQLIGASFPSLSIGPQLSSVRAKVRRPATVGISIAPSAVPATLIGLANPLTVGLAAGGALLAAGLLARNLPLFLIGAIVLVATCAYVRRQEPAHLLVLLMTGTGLILSLAVEFLVLKGDIGRMNTVFKFYLQIWMLLGTAAGIAVAVAIMERYVRRRAGFDVWFVVLGILLLAAAMYPAMSIPARVGDRYAALPPTLDGMAYMDHATYNDTPEGRQPVSFSLAGDAAAIQWLRDGVDGSPVVLEATIPGYRWGSRVSVYTGLPTVLGWDWHQTQQRPGFGMMIQERRDDVAYMFGADTPFDLITPLLDRYHVRLIYVGELERAYYDPVGLAKFDDAVLAGELTVVYQAQGVTIYQYDGESSG